MISSVLLIPIGNRVEGQMTVIVYIVGSYTQRRIVGDLAFADLRFLSSRKAARAESCALKTTAAALDR